MNPVRAAMVRCAEEYVWSSYRRYLALDSVVDWVSSDRLLAEAGGLDRYRVFVESGLASDDESPFERAAAGVFFGGEHFVKEMRALIRQPKQPGDLSGYRRLNRLQPAPIEDLRAIVDDFLRDLSQCQRRRILGCVLRRLSLMTGREIAQLIGRSESTVSEAWHQMEKKMAVNEDWANRMNELCRLVRQASESR